MPFRGPVQKIVRKLDSLVGHLQLPGPAKAECYRDLLGLPKKDPGARLAMEEAMAWLCRAQDGSTSRDGGVARHYSLIKGWSASYPETTGYIAPTFLDYARFSKNEEFKRRAKRMLDWLVSIQFPEGGFQGGCIDCQPVVPVTFNTGQILLGLASGTRELGEEYREPMRRAADWLVKTQDPDGCWRKFPTPFAAPGEKSYETHASWGLLEAARLEPEKPYGAAGLANVRWALRQQQENGWFDKCCLSNNKQPLTHSIGYVLRGVLEAYRFYQNPEFLKAGQKTADRLLATLRKDGFLPGQFDSRWRGTVPCACLTGTVQIAACWLLLHEITGDSRYLEAASSANRYIRRTMNLTGPPEIRGGIKGSFPVNGNYGSYQYLSWAAKFLVDANLLELAVAKRDSAEDEGCGR